jgi:hypothetical protein
MIPSVLSSQVREGIEDFLKTTFPVSTPFFHGVMERFLGAAGGIFKGPYISVKLPYRTSSIGPDFFEGIPLRFPPYLHQEMAFRRLAGEEPVYTVSATARVRERRSVFSIRSWITAGGTGGNRASRRSSNENLECALLYVSATRAKKKVVITSYGKEERSFDKLVVLFLIADTRHYRCSTTPPTKAAVMSMGLG